MRFILLPFFFFSFFFWQKIHASYVIYHDDTSTYSIGSVPVNSGFTYRSNGNSIGYREVHSVPVIYPVYPNATWVPVEENRFPVNAIVYQYINGRAIYYCRIQVAGQIKYGQLVPNQGCFLFDYPADPAYTSYQILVR